MEQAARTYQVDSALLHAVISAESGYNSVAVSNKGAAGLMQLMPETARRYGVMNSLDPEQNIRGGTKYLSDLLQLFDNNLELAVAAYNAWDNTVIRLQHPAVPGNTGPSPQDSEVAKNTAPSCSVLTVNILLADKNQPIVREPRRIQAQLGEVVAVSR